MTNNDQRHIHWNNLKIRQSICLFLFNFSFLSTKEKCWTAEKQVIGKSTYQSHSVACVYERVEYRYVWKKEFIFREKLCSSVHVHVFEHGIFYHRRKCWKPWLCKFSPMSINLRSEIVCKKSSYIQRFALHIFIYCISF